MIPQALRCARCSAPIGAAMRFCGACGTSLDEPAHSGVGSRRHESTMMGMPVVSVPPAAAPPDGDHGARVIPFTPERRAPHATVRGMPESGAAARAAHATLTGIPIAPPVPPPPTTPSAPVLPSARSVFGASARPDHALGAGRARSTTDPGFGAALALDLPPAPPASPMPAPEEAPRPAPLALRPRRDVAREREAFAQAATPKKPKRSLRAPALVVGLALLAALGAGAFWLFAHRAPELRARAHVATVGGHESLVVDVPRAGFGVRVRFRGQEVPLVAARAVLPLRAPLAIGENRLALGLVDERGRTAELPVEVTVPYRLRPDLSALTAEPPRFRVQVEALPGTVVELAGSPLALDARGRGARDFPLRGRTDGSVITETVRYRVVPPSGAPQTGAVTARIPIATLALDRPGRALVTDAASVAVAGAVHSTATVTVNGVPVPVREGRFEHVLPLPRPGEHEITVVAREAGHAPDRESVVVRRVPDLAAEARAYEVERSLTYSRIAADPDGSRGRRVAFEGIVYNVEVSRGQSMLQMLVSRCGEARCPLWVTFPAATDVQLDQKVRVLGEVDGEQRFRTRGSAGQILTVPRVRAVYVLPITP